MKAEIQADGTLVIISQNELEYYALEQWQKENINPCTLQFKNKSGQYLYFATESKKITLFQRIKLKIQLFLYR